MEVLSHYFFAQNGGVYIDFQPLDRRSFTVNGVNIFSDKE